MLVKKKVIEVECHQWCKNGDHPDDGSVMVSPHKYSNTQYNSFLSEGKIVQYFRRPDSPGNPCSICGKSYKLHGWIDTLEGGHIVCPGDYIITGSSGEYYPIKPDIFDKTYDIIEL